MVLFFFFLSFILFSLIDGYGKPPPGGDDSIRTGWNIAGEGYSIRRVLEGQALLIDGGDWPLN